MKMFDLKSGDKMPALGLGTWLLRGEKCTRSVNNALQMGYRHIDTAIAYENHQAIAPALLATDISRDELFITSKITREKLRYDDVLKEGEKIIKELQVDYIDLLLIHWPNKNIPLSETLKAMSKLKQKGTAKNIGISNFTIHHLKDAMGFDENLISVNQVEFHPYLYQKKLLQFCQNNNIVLTAYCPLARGKVLNDKKIKEIAQKCDKTPAQIALKWAVDKGIVVIPKSGSEQHLRENMQLFDWELPEEAKKQLDSLNQNKRLVDPGSGEFDY